MHDRIQAWETPAVIFSGGTSLGSHRNPLTGKDVVQEIFDGREAAAGELSHSNNLLASLPADPHMRLSACLGLAALEEVTGVMKRFLQPSIKWTNTMKDQCCWH
jgi:hypothetical protein